MAGGYLQRFARQQQATPQSEPIFGRESEQVQNQAGGYGFQVTIWDQLDRFLVLGSEGATYYASEQKMTRANAQNVVRCIAEDGLRAVARICEVSQLGRAPKNDPALFALALCAAAEDVKVRQAALNSLPQVARIGTHLLHFAAYVRANRGWGRALRRAMGETWYGLRPVEKVALQAIKYRQRDGWTHRDVLRLAHPTTHSMGRRGLYEWMTHPDRLRDDGTIVAGPRKVGVPIDHNPEEWLTRLPDVIVAGTRLMQTTDAAIAAELIIKHNLPRECVPTGLLNSREVWEALLVDMPMTAMIRSLGKMSQIGLLTPLSAASRLVTERLGSEELLRRARVHPIAILLAMKTYAQGHGDKGRLTWVPEGRVVDALDSAFYMAFKNVPPTNKRILLALDVSGSMGAGSVAGTSLTPREAGAAMALVIANTEPNHAIIGFTGGGPGSFQAGVGPIDISPHQRLDQVVKYTAGLPMGGTDCALPMLYARSHKMEVDGFLTITDNESWAGSVHPTQALQSYRQAAKIAAKSVVLAMTATQFSVADPADGGQMDIVGMDTSAPQLIADFLRG